MASRDSRGQAFVSKKTIDSKREARQEYFKGVLKDAQDDIDRKEKERKRKHESGEDRWMLPSLSSRVIDETSKDSHGSDKKKKKKSKKHKKHKKHKKKQKKNQRENTDTSDSSYNSDGSSNDEWCEKEAGGDLVSVETSPDDVPIKESPVERESWMLSSSLLDHVADSSKSREQTRKNEKTEIKAQKESSIEQVGQHARELNPYWKDGGKGLPTESPVKAKAEVTQSANIGDAGRSWIHKAYERAKEQAEQQGRRFEDVVIERWGSMEKLNALLGVAERSTRHRPRENQGTRTHSKDRWRKYKKDDKDERDERVHETENHTRTRENEETRTYSKDRWRKYKEDDKDDRVHETEKHARNHGSPHDDDSGFRKPTLFKKPDPNRKKYKANQEYNTSSKLFSRKKESQLLRAEENVSHTPENSLTTKVTQESDSSSSDGEEGGMESEEDIQPLTEKELNELNAKILRAELMGNEEIAGPLRKKLETNKRASGGTTTKKATDDKKKPEKTSSTEDVEQVVLTRTDQHGNVYPLQLSGENDEQKGKRRKKKKIETHDAQGKRIRYFKEDDDATDLRTMVQREKLTTVADQSEMWSQLSRKVVKTDEDYTLDDMFVTASATSESRGAKEEKLKNKAITESRKLMTQLANCRFCFESPEIAKHLIIAIATKVYLAVPISKSFTDGHCLIIPMPHITASTFLDEDILQEVQAFKKTLVEIFKEMDKDVVFLETCRNVNLKKQYHMVLECLPISKEDGDMAPIYFKKAILESETEWSQNKKLVDITRQGGIRKAVPKGLAYFAVEFGLDGGFAHIIEDDDTFPHYFGKEIIGGMLDLEPVMWRKPPKENFHQHKKKVLRFSDWWKPFDWTQKIGKY